MGPTATRTLVLCLTGFLSIQSSSTAASQAGGAWTVLLEGKILDGWNVVGDANWTVADGAVQADKGSGFLVTPASYRDFQITLEFWVSDDANSGVFLRCSDPKAITQMNAYEVNIFDKRPDQSYRTGGIVDVAKPATVIHTGGKWNTYDITAKGSQLTVVLNGAKVVDMKDTKHVEGPIALQYGAGIVKFRNVRIRQL
jgi:3-keto-disaccharide hydrolase